MDVYLKRLNDELRLRNYSPKTIKSYSACVADFLQAKKDNFKSVDLDFIKQFLLVKKDRGMSSQTINQNLQAINFFYRDVLKKYVKIDRTHGAKSICQCLGEIRHSKRGYFSFFAP